MAKAPRPGVGKRTDEVKAAKRLLKIRICDEERILPSVDNLPLKERLIVRKATGLPVEAFLGEVEFGVDSLQVIWWLAGRAAGDPFLTLKKVVEDWPEELTEDDVDLSEVTAEDPTLDGTDPQS